MLNNARHKAMYLELRIQAMKTMKFLLNQYRITKDKSYYETAKFLGGLSKEWKEEIDKLK